MRKTLTNEQVEEIKRRVHKTDTISGLAREFGVDRSTIYNRLSEKRRKENIIRATNLVRDDIEETIKNKKSKP